MKEPNENNIIRISNALATFAESPSWGIKVVEEAKKIYQKRGMSKTEIRARFRSFDKLKFPISGVQYLRLQNTYKKEL